MYAGSLFIQQLLGWNLYLSIGLILLITAIYTIGGEQTFSVVIKSHLLPEALN